MPKMKGLGRDIDKSLKVFEELKGKLNEFMHVPLKRGLKFLNIQDENLSKKISDLRQKAVEVHDDLDILSDAIVRDGTESGTRSSRFASRVVQKFLGTPEKL